MYTQPFCLVHEFAAYVSLTLIMNLSLFMGILPSLYLSAKEAFTIAQNCQNYSHENPLFTALQRQG
jgi:hypothetical protein